MSVEFAPSSGIGVPAAGPAISGSFAEGPVGSGIGIGARPAMTAEIGVSPSFAGGVGAFKDGSGISLDTTVPGSGIAKSFDTGSYATLWSATTPATTIASSLIEIAGTAPGNDISQTEKDALFSDIGAHLKSNTEYDATFSDIADFLTQTVPTKSELPVTGEGLVVPGPEISPETAGIAEKKLTEYEADVVQTKVVLGIIEDLIREEDVETASSLQKLSASLAGGIPQNTSEIAEPAIGTLVIAKNEQEDQVQEETVTLETEQEVPPATDQETLTEIETVTAEENSMEEPDPVHAETIIQDEKRGAKRVELITDAYAKARAIVDMQPEAAKKKDDEVILPGDLVANLLVEEGIEQNK